jgi:NADP-dependent aldehyde dehydrogenase
VPRLTGEVARTTAQLRLFADAVLEGSYLEATIDHPDPSTIPPRPDLRRMLRPLGPVAVFGASNFPFAFSVAGGDTASALAAGCPVIVKGHPAHPRLSRRTAAIVAGALVAAGAPEGVFGHVEGHETGVALVQHPEIRAVGFTGSLRGGRALFDLAQQRPDPIPFYGELSAVNPVLITAAALEARAEELAAGLAGSFTLGAGQFCTNPGVVFVPAGSGFAEQVGAAVAAASAGPVPMLTDGIADAFAAGVTGLADHADVEVVAGDPSQQPGTGAAVVLRTTTAAVLDDPGTLFHECFGPSTLVVEYADVADALAAVPVGGSLTATVHAQPGEDLAPIVEVLAEVAGRVLFAGWPTGVAVSWAQQHGGPWPSTTTIHTSVGVTAMRRFLRPIAFQDAPDAALPPELRDENVLGIPRRVNGVLVLRGQSEPVA